MQEKKLYVGNLNYSVTDEDLTELFSSYGEVVSANIINDRETGRSKGFGFVEMGTGESAVSAKDGLNGTDFNGRTLKIDLAKPKKQTRNFRKY